MEQLKTIWQILDHAKQHVQYPKLRLQLSDNNPLQLTMTGRQARFPNRVCMTDGGSFGNNQYFGTFDKDGHFYWSSRVTAIGKQEITTVLQLFADNPIAYAKLYGDTTGQCMYCGKHLSNPQSVAVGYGPICAGNFGLPWGDLDNDVAKAASQVELQLEDFALDLPQQSKLHNDISCALNACQQMLDNLEAIQSEDIREVVNYLWIANETLLREQIK